MSVRPVELQSQVLSTLLGDGSRRWLSPRLSRGRFLRARCIVAYMLIGLFCALPLLTVRGKPALLIDLPRRELTVFGFTFLPTDTVLLALMLVALIVGICLATALLGRVLCGWMCPQTVYMEFVYRPLERLFDGAPGARHKAGRQTSPLRMVLKYAAYLLVSAWLAHTFVAYFVGVEALKGWIGRSPLDHPIAFSVAAIVTGLMVFDFSYFREQMCIVACPYGRFQSVMLDRESLIVSYDRRRGEPRGRAKPGNEGPRGDCIDCGSCADTCPTGIDIRGGLQLECIACTQCIDACNAVMDRVGKPRGLIRFSSQSRMEGNPGRLLRPRVVLYPAVMLGLVAAFTVVLLRKQPADVTLLRGLGTPFTELAPGEITNQLRVKIKNRSDSDAVYRIGVADEAPARVSQAADRVEVKAGDSATTAIMITAPATAFRNGQYDIALRVSDGGAFSQDLPYRLLGPRQGATPGDLPSTSGERP